MLLTPDPQEQTEPNPWDEKTDEELKAEIRNFVTGDPERALELGLTQQEKQ